jgi:probable DNA repair protein
MGPHTAEEIDHWLRTGGLVLTASERAARSLIDDFHHRRRAEGLAAWPAPYIVPFAAFVRAEWERRSPDARMALNPAQEQTLWAAVLARESHLATLLEGPRQRLAALAAEAHALLCSHAARYLDPAARASWDRDPAAFSRWLTAFDADSARHGVLSTARLPLELISLLQADSTPRPPLLIAGFDRLLPVQRALFGAWDQWRELAPAGPAAELHFYSAPDQAAEFAACAAWCARELEAHPGTRLLVLTQSIATHRGTLERAFLRALPADAFEFSLGISLAAAPLPRAVYLLLRWLSSPLAENEIDWLLSTGFAASADEALAAQLHMRALRRRGFARPSWPLDAFLAQSVRISSESTQPFAAWSRRMIEGHRTLISAQANFRTPLDWSTLALDLLTSLGIPGNGLSSAAHQSWQRFQDALSTAASLGFDGRRIPWSEFLAQLARILADALYAPESHSAPVQIAGPAESAGLHADAVWFLGASEDTWPAPGSTHPFLPLHVQRESAMPHATPQLDWQLAAAVTARVTASAPRVHFSFAARTDATEARPSRLIAQLTGEPQPLPAGLAAPAPPAPLAEEFTEAPRIPFPHATIPGGAAVLTSQSQCPFQAFATARLGGRAWDAAEFGLSAPQRGQLLHAVLHSIWSGQPGPPRGLHSLADLHAVGDLDAFVAAHVEAAMQTDLPTGARDRMPTRYLELEAERLRGLVVEWLAFESARVPFTVEQTESKATAAVGPLTLSLRLDRIDRLADGTPAVIDYKTGDVAASAWKVPRPEDVQLPLYAAFALPAEPGALLFAKLRAGESRFVGLARDARATLIPTLTGRDTLVKNPLTDEQLDSWYATIVALADDFVTGRAVVDPRDWPKTCKRCDLHAVCRIHENRAANASDEETADA